MALNLNDIVNVVVNVAPASTMRNAFDQGLIVGKSTIITAAARVVEYASLDEMTAGGWTGTEAEYKAAQLYFAQTSSPTKVAIGRWDDTGSETAVQAVQACRDANKDWYAVHVCGAVKTDIIAVATLIETMQPASVQFYTTKDAEILTNTAGNVFLTLQASKRRRSIGQYSNVDNAAAGMMGYAMGANTRLANSAYTLANKSISGVSTESVTSAQLTTIESANGNIYINRGGSYNVFEPGVMADGTHFDEVINLDMLADDIQKSVMDVLVSNAKVAQTETGVSVLVNAITVPCAEARTRGFLAPGIWTGPQILTLKTGDVLPQGFTVLADTIANQSAADKAARKSPPIYVAVKLAGAIEHAVINVMVNRA